MPATLSKEEEEDSSVLAQREQAVRALSVSFLFGVSALCSPIQTEPELIQQLYKGDLGAAATAIATVSGLSGLLEFTLNPTLGRLSDVIGRRPFFVIGPSVVCLSNLLVALQGGTYKPLVLLNGVLRRAGATFGGSVATMAVLADICEGHTFSTAFARVFGMAGLGVIVGPLVAGLVQRVVPGSPRAVYLLTAAFAALQIANNLHGIPETKPAPPPGAPSPSFEGVVSPFAFTQLFGHSSALSKLVVSAALISFVEGKNLNDLGLLWFRNDCAISPRDISTYVTLWGIGAVASGSVFVPSLLRRLGMRGFTSFTALTTLTYLVLTSAVPALTRGRRVPTLLLTYFNFMFLLPGINAGSASALKGWATSHAAASGFGSGEYAAYFSNLRAITTTLASRYL